MFFYPHTLEKSQKTYTMVQKDLERAGIPYETHEGMADFHAAGRHSHITGLVRSGASLMEAKELARHADIKQTTRYVHIGMEDRAEALGNLPAPKTYASVDLSGMCRVWGGALSQELSSDDSDDDPDDDPENDKTPCGKGVLSSCVTDFQELSVDVRSGGGGNCTRVPRSFGSGRYVLCMVFREPQHLAIGAPEHRPPLDIAQVAEVELHDQTAVGLIFEHLAGMPLSLPDPPGCQRSKPQDDIVSAGTAHCAKAPFHVIVRAETGRAVARLARLLHRSNPLDREHPDLGATVAIAEGIPTVIDQGELVGIEEAARGLVSAGCPVNHLQSLPAYRRTQ